VFKIGENFKFSNLFNDKSFFEEILVGDLKELEHGIVNQKHIDNKYKKLEKLLANRNYIDELNKRAVTD
jgi:hypothetical protein